MAVRLFVGNLSYSTTEADLRTYFGTGRATLAGRAARRSRNRPAARIRVRRIHRASGRRASDSAVQRSDVQRTPARRERSARARRSRTWRSAAAGWIQRSAASRRRLQRPSTARWFQQRPTPGRWGRLQRSAAPFDPSAPPAPRGSRNFGPDAKPQRGPNAKAKKKEAERPRGPIPLKNTGRSFSLDDDSPDESLPDIDDFATSKPTDETDKDKDKDKDDE